MKIKIIKFYLCFTLISASFFSCSSYLNNNFEEKTPATLIVAHRGASAYAPENSIKAFNLAWEQNADVIEGDFYLTKDNKVVCCHNRNTGITSQNDINLNISESTYEELLEVDLGQNQKIPLLEEVLDTIPKGKKINIEIKDSTSTIYEIQKILKNKINQKKLCWNQIRIISLNINVLTLCKKLMPQIPCSYVVPFILNKNHENKILHTLKSNNIEGCSFNYIYNNAADFINTLKDNNIEPHVWTINNTEQAKMFLDMEVASITTNYPDKLVEIRN